MPVLEIAARIAGVLSEVEEERYDQLDKWGEQLHSPHQWLAILTEECGEVAKEVADGRIEQFRACDYRAELIQVAAVAVAAIEAHDALLGAYREQVVPRAEYERACPPTEPDQFLQ